MYISRRKPQDDIPEEITAIWSCANEKCNGWMRDNFAFSIQPTCPQCRSVMMKCEKKLSVLVNTSPFMNKHRLTEVPY
jgi:ABC-type ATPase with predicted acetyltransferase domain